MIHFSTSRRIPQTSNNIFSIKQQDRESLRDYVVHFNTATLEVYDLNESTAISAMKRRLHSFRFTYSLDKIFFRTYAKLFERTKKYIGQWVRDMPIPRLRHGPDGLAVNAL